MYKFELKFNIEAHDEFWKQRSWWADAYTIWKEMRGGRAVGFYVCLLGINFSVAVWVRL